uniref:Uncharacterized protein n=1 Tax=Mustela putorius furo TaxID=9669 RepID=M3XMP5_MUSPF
MLCGQNSVGLEEGEPFITLCSSYTEQKELNRLPSSLKNKFQNGVDPFFWLVLIPTGTDFCV